MKTTIFAVLMLGHTLCLLNGCRPERYVVVDCVAKEVQAIVAKVNMGVGEDKYDTVLLFHGKDPFLAASCIVSSNEWAKIISTGNPRDAISIIEREGITVDGSLKTPLGCFLVDGISYYGFLQDEKEVRLIVENYGDEKGKFPKEFWEIVSRNAK